MALFDTLHASQRLRDEAGQSQEVAETIADVIGRAVAPMVRLDDLMVRLDDFVTRAEFHQALHAMEIRIGGLVIAVAGICLAIAKLT